MAALPAWAGPYPAAAGEEGSTAIAANDPRIIGWATSVTSLIRGPQDIAFPTGERASFGTGSEALGQAQGNAFNVVSLGDGGSITVSFDFPIANKPGPDFAVFENGFDAGFGYFLELAFVEVSSDGVNFARFPSVSLTPTSEQLGNFDVIDPTDIHNLAGKYSAGYGTPFDLSDIAPAEGLDLYNIHYVRIVDVVGRVTPTGDYIPSLDSQGHIINDPYETPYITGGFDLDGIAVLNANLVIPEPTSAGLALGGTLLLSRRLRKS